MSLLENLFESIFTQNDFVCVCACSLVSFGSLGGWPEMLVSDVKGPRQFSRKI